MIRKISTELKFPEDAIKTLETAYKQITKNETAFALFKNAEQKMFADADDTKHLDLLQEISELLNIHRYTADMVFWLNCALPLKEIYEKHKLPEDIYRSSMADLKYKLDECKNLYNIWGTFTQWFPKFYHLKRFGFGRLQFDISCWEDGSYKGIVNDGDLTFRCHIPSGQPLYKEAVMDSINRLYSFYKKDLKDGILVIYCASWLLYPPVVNVCKPDSNMRKFYDLFDIFYSAESSDPYAGFWRIFNMNYEGPASLEKVPLDTGFRRAMKKYFSEGGAIGLAKGVILFDGEKIINK